LIATEAGAKISVKSGIWNGEKHMVIAAGPTLHAALTAQIEAGPSF
jgi:hypothetical protein